MWTQSDPAVLLLNIPLETQIRHGFAGGFKFLKVAAIPKAVLAQVSSNLPYMRKSATNLLVLETEMKVEPNNPFKLDHSEYLSLRDQEWVFEPIASRAFLERQPSPVSSQSSPTNSPERRLPITPASPIKEGSNTEELGYSNVNRITSSMADMITTTETLR
jgi:hypothetical protein